MMTEDQKKIKRYVTEIERALRMPLKTKARINHDLATEIQLLKEQGLTADEIIAQMGTPEEVAENPDSYTGYYVKKMLDRAK